MKLWIGNIAPGTTEKELRDLLARSGVDVVASIEQVPGDGTRPAAILEIGATQDFMLKLTQRLNGMHFKGRPLMVQAITR